jgi:hypothetical protein
MSHSPIAPIKVKPKVFMDPTFLRTFLPRSRVKHLETQVDDKIAWGPFGGFLCYDSSFVC